MAGASRAARCGSDGLWDQSLGSESGIRVHQSHTLLRGRHQPSPDSSRGEASSCTVLCSSKGEASCCTCDASRMVIP
eukprot:7390760-Prymnesium_polylepis.2